MNEQDMHHAFEKINPGESLYTREWWEFTRPLSPTARGLLITLLPLMFLRGWSRISDLPHDIHKLERALRICTRGDARALGRLLPKLKEKKAEEAVQSQLARMRRWPALLIEEFAP